MTTPRPRCRHALAAFVAAAVAAAPARAQLPAEPVALPGQPVGAAPAAVELQAEAEKLPAEELHIRTGIMLLAGLYKTLAQVQDAMSAQAAVAEVMRHSRELHAWAQSVTSLPPISEETARAYERRYLPAIRKLNDHLRAQGERLAASDYYGAQELSLALISLYSMAQQ